MNIAEVGILGPQLELLLGWADRGSSKHVARNSLVSTVDQSSTFSIFIIISQNPAPWPPTRTHYTCKSLGSLKMLPQEGIGCPD